MRITMRKNDDVARRQIDTLGATFDARARPALGQQVIDDDVARSLTQDGGERKPQGEENSAL